MSADDKSDFNDLTLETKKCIVEAVQKDGSLIEKLKACKDKSNEDDLTCFKSLQELKSCFKN